MSLSLNPSMANRSLYKTLIKHKPTFPIAPKSRSLTFRTQSTQSSFSDSIAIEKIEDAIHGIIVKRSEPDWLVFVPGSSYWVPPRRGSYGIAELVEKLANQLTEEEAMSLSTSRGWPSSAFFTLNEKPPAEDEEEN